AALDAGINFFDTAEGYENSEVILGKGLKGRRHEAVIATKVSAGNLSTEDIESACERSLKHLGTEYIDHYQVHWPSRKIPLDETVAALERLKTSGKIRAIGVCNFGTEDLSNFLALGRCETDQLPYSLLWRVIEHEIQPLCVQESVGLICYSPLMQGLLTGRYTSADDVPDGISRTRLYSSTRPMADHNEPGCETEVFAALDRIQDIANSAGKSMAELSLAWARQQLGITSLLVGARNPDELRRNLPAADLVLTPKTLRELAETTLEVKEKLGLNPDMWHSNSRMR
ncbi:MAG: aldo/keto reductase, partial [bacterium]|nr:aldo/keto reductase [bacterium]